MPRRSDERWGSRVPPKSACGSTTRAARMTRAARVARARGGMRSPAVLWEAKTWRRQPLFRDPVLAAYVLGRLDRRRGLLAAVVMPASMRWLSSPAGPRRADIEKLQLECERFFLRRGYDGRLWQPASLGHRPIAASEVGRAIARLRQRPVAAGLVEWARNYPWLVVRRDSLAELGLELDDAEIGCGGHRFSGAARIRG